MFRAWLVLRSVVGKSVQRLLYILSLQFSNSVRWTGSLPSPLFYIPGAEMLIEVKKPARSDRASNSRPAGPPKAPVSIPKGVSLTFPVAEFFKGVILIFLSKQKALQKSVYQVGKRAEIGTSTILTPFYIQAICLRSNLDSLSSDLLPNNMRITVLFHRIMFYNFSFWKLFSMVRYKPRW